MSKLQGISPRLPLEYSTTDGPYALNKNLRDVIRQNFKMLVLTSPGERIMVPDFGVGLNNFLFESMGDEAYSEIVSRIKEQTSAYIPAINLTGISFITSDEDPTISFNQVRVSIKYNILPYNGSDELVITSQLTT